MVATFRSVWNPLARGAPGNKGCRGSKFFAIRNARKAASDAATKSKDRPARQRMTAFGSHANFRRRQVAAQLRTFEQRDKDARIRRSSSSRACPRTPAAAVSTQPCGLVRLSSAYRPRTSVLVARSRERCALLKIARDATLPHHC